MSLCRFSSDDWKSDVYIYKSKLGYYVINVASGRHVPHKPLPPKIDMENMDGKEEDKAIAFAERFMQVYEIIQDSKLVAIGGKYDGMTFVCNTADKTIKQLREIQEEGYHVPNFVYKLLGSEES